MINISSHQSSGLLLTFLFFKIVYVWYCFKGMETLCSVNNDSHICEKLTSIHHIALNYSYIYDCVWLSSCTHRYRTWHLYICMYTVAVTCLITTSTHFFSFGRVSWQSSWRAIYIKGRVGVEWSPKCHAVDLKHDWFYTFHCVDGNTFTNDLNLIVISGFFAFNLN